MKKIRIICKENDNPRIDYYLSKATIHSRSNIAKLIASDFVKKNGVEIKKSSESVGYGDIISVDFSSLSGIKLNPTKMTLNIMYEDEDILVISKKSGIVVHYANSHTGDTLVDGIINQFPDIKNVGDPDRPGIVHRLDKETSGLIVIAKNNLSYKTLKQMFKDRKIKKEYIGIVTGSTPQKGRIDAPIGRHPLKKIKRAVIEGGKEALTSYEKLMENQGLTLLLIKIQTGRMHQIRVHLSSIGHPIYGDTLYSSSRNFKPDRLFLHASRINFEHPLQKKILDIKDEMPKCFRQTMNLNKIIF